jgi:phage terminase large subunit
MNAPPPKNISLSLTQPQEDFVFSEAKHPGLVAGYGSGKSHAAVVRIAIRALQYPKLSFAFVEPTFDLIRLIAYPRFMNLFDEWGVKYKLNRADNIVTVENDAQIIFRSADTPERLVGFEVADAVIDEADTLRPEQAADVWAKMLGRCRAEKTGWGAQHLGGGIYAGRLWLDVRDIREKPEAGV